MTALYLLAAQLVAFLAWCGYDAYRSFTDGDSASKHVKAWIREAQWHRLAVGLIVVDAAVYLVLHWVLQVV